MGYPLNDRLEESPVVSEFGDGGGLAARNHERCDRSQIPSAAHALDSLAAVPKGSGMLSDVALQGQNADHEWGLLPTALG